MFTSHRRAAALVVLLALAAPAPAEIVLVGRTSIPGTATDLSGLTNPLYDGTPHNRLGAMGSGIAWTGDGPHYLMLTDRGVGDGTTDYFCRMHLVSIVVPPAPSGELQFTLLATRLLRDEAGRNFTGASRAFDAAAPLKSLRLDPEGIRVGRTGSVFISDEYGPYVWEFSPEGRRLQVLKVPEHFLVKNPGATPEDELPPHNTVGRIPNRGLEGLAISPDGGKLYGLLQSPLLQDSALDGDRWLGSNCRILELDVGGGAAPREFVFPLEDVHHGTNEILAVNDHEFLVIERDNKEGDKARFKKIIKIDIAAASDVSGIEALPAQGLPAGVTAVRKGEFIDLLDRRFGLAGPSFPEKIEGLAFGPDLPDGRHLLLVTTDNDLKADVPTWIYAFAVPAEDLPDYRPQSFERLASDHPLAIPDLGRSPPASSPFLVVGIVVAVLVALGLLWLVWRRRTPN
jgi:hypothetical protein